MMDRRRLLMVNSDASIKYELLASGEITTGSSTLNITIPLTQVNGTGVLAFISAVNPRADTAQTVSAYCLASAPDDTKVFMPNGYAGYCTLSATGTLTAFTLGRANIGSTFLINPSYIYFGRPAPGSPWQPNTTYSWQLYGVKGG